MVCLVQQQEKERITVGKWRYVLPNIPCTNPQGKSPSYFEPGFCYSHIYHNSKNLCHLECYLTFQYAQCIKQIFPDLLDTESSIRQSFKDTKYLGVFLVSWDVGWMLKSKRMLCFGFFHIYEFKSSRAEAKF